MRKSTIAVIAILSLVFSTAVAFAAPVNLPESIKGKEGVWLSEREVPILVGEDVPVGMSAGLVFDSFERKIKDSTKIQGKFWGAKLALTLADKVDIYTHLGAMTDGEYTNKVGGALTFDSGFMWGIGGNLVLYDWESQSIKFFTDINYRSAAGMDYDAMRIDGVEYAQDRIIQDSEGEYREWQIALGMSRPINEYLIPYGGILFADAKAKAMGSRVGGGGSVGGGVKAKDMIGPFVGIAYLPVKGVSIDLQGRFVTEDAVTVTSEVKF